MMNKGLEKANLDARLANAEEMLNTIHAQALSDDHLYVAYNGKNQLEMAHAVIRRMERKLMNIAELAQVGLGD
jgi:cob(I)alamin adenosyltransferase